MIKPCPFCGNLPSLIMESGRGHYMVIKCCIVNHRISTEFYTPKRGTWYDVVKVRDDVVKVRDELVKMWNTRI